MSTAGPAFINVSGEGNVTFNLEDRTSANIAKAGTATMTAGIAGSADDGTGGFVQFFGHSTADQAAITAYVGSNIEFHDASSAGNATLIVGNAALPTGAADNGFLFFNDTATAGHANITVNQGGELDFSPPFGPPCCTGGTATAGNATFLQWDDRVLQRDDAGNATITTTTPFGVTNFHDTSNAGAATFTVAGEGVMNFFDQSSADAASIHVDGTSSVNFHDGTTAGTAKLSRG